MSDVCPTRPSLQHLLPHSGGSIHVAQEHPPRDDEAHGMAWIATATGSPRCCNRKVFEGVYHFRSRIVARTLSSLQEGELLLRPRQGVSTMIMSNNVFLDTSVMVESKGTRSAQYSSGISCSTWTEFRGSSRAGRSSRTFPTGVQHNWCFESRLKRLSRCRRACQQSQSSRS